jgi:hypothetical protein
MRNMTLTVVIIIVFLNTQVRTLPAQSTYSLTFFAVPGLQPAGTQQGKWSTRGTLVCEASHTRVPGQPTQLSAMFSNSACGTPPHPLLGFLTSACGTPPPVHGLSYNTSGTPPIAPRLSQNACGTPPPASRFLSSALRLPPAVHNDPSVIPVRRWGQQTTGQPLSNIYHDKSNVKRCTLHNYGNAQHCHFHIRRQPRATHIT